MTVQNLTNRLLSPEESKHFIFEDIDSSGKDRFELSTRDGKILIKGTSPVAMASGLNWYLKYYCNSSVSWSGNQINIPKPLPAIDGMVSKQSAFKYAYYLNYCTFNYTMSFWDWERWEQEIDWMAMNGVNLPLAITGTEAVWYNVLKRLDYSDEDILKFIPGPAFTSWWLMTNLEGWGGPISMEYMSQQVELQKKILKRMREYGMDPVLPGFYGMVPNYLKDKYPDADIRDQGVWAGGFKRPAFLMPTDSLFLEIANIFYEEQKKLFGETEYFSGDPFHEGGSTTGIDLPAAGKNLIGSVKNVYPKAKWIFQAWHANPRSEMLSKIDGEDILILDLDADNNPQWSQKNAWDNKNWIWSTITNYGGNVGMFGRLDVINRELLKALQKHPQSLKGIGVMPEAIENNPVVYELLYEFRWRNSSVDMDAWLADYAHRRYGPFNANINKAWEVLNKTVYGKTLGFSNQQGTNESLFCARPSKNITGVSTWGTTKIHYNPKDLLEAWHLFVRESAVLKESRNFQYDLVDITRQVLANYAQVLYADMMHHYKNKNLDAFVVASKKFTDLVKEQNQLLNSKKDFMLGFWLEAAKSRATNTAEKALFEYNARAQITTWSFQDSNLHDYAHREWGGMLSDFYLPRWEMFISKLASELKGGNPGELDYYSFEDSWNKEHKNFPTKEQGDCIVIANELYSKYYDEIIASYK
ncbi:alpha-N-acetylglucosaminidase [Saccharicrinis carchari]|nr:alpha-N-acetylglucosaminidase [Saccharicrinis carchari]